MNLRLAIQHALEQHAKWIATAEIPDELPGEHGGIWDAAVEASARALAAAMQESLPKFDPGKWLATATLHEQSGWAPTEPTAAVEIEPEVRARMDADRAAAEEAMDAETLAADAAELEAAEEPSDDEPADVDAAIDAELAAEEAKGVAGDDPAFP